MNLGKECLKQVKHCQCRACQLDFHSGGLKSYLQLLFLSASQSHSPEKVKRQEERHVRDAHTSDKKEWLDGHGTHKLASQSAKLLDSEMRKMPTYLPYTHTHQLTI